MQVTEFADWQQVAEWAAPLYGIDAPPSAELEAQIAELRAIGDPEKRIQAALRFVQDEIRYLGIESGVGSHQPTAPSEVLRRRFGDCKDKTLLLATLLRQTGIAAAPSLVSTYLRGNIADRLPSPGVFNHVILQVDTGHSVHWLDATRAYQRGPLSQIAIGRFGAALVLRPGTKELTVFSPPKDSLPRKRIVETYRVKAPPGDALLDVVTEFYGASAESTRSDFATVNKDEIQKRYVRFYANRFSRIQAAQPVEYRDLPDGAGCVVTEHYRVPDLWKLNDEKNGYWMRIHPSDVAGEMGDSGPAERNDPLALAHPVNLTQEMQVDLFEDWPLTAANREVTNGFFRFHHDSSGNGSHVRLIYSFESLADQVSAAETPVYDKALRELRATLGYTFTYQTPEQIAAGKGKEAAPASSQFNWPIGLLLFGVVAVGIVLSFRYYHTSRLPEPLPPSLTHPQLEGIGGWLFLVAFGIIMRPIMFLTADLQLFPVVFELDRWLNLTRAGAANYHPYWIHILLLELIFNSLGIVFCVLVLFLFFSKRQAWQRCFVYLLVYMAAGVFLDTCLGYQIPAIAPKMGDSTKALFQNLLSCAIWIPYAVRSQRVRATFRY